MRTRTKQVALLIFILWILATTVQSLFSFPGMIKHSLAQSLPADRQALRIAQIVHDHIGSHVAGTILYLNGIDGGDNYYRIRYLLYPIAFVDYWSWGHPDAGGYVWNVPRFDTAVSLRHILLSRHVRYVIAVSDPDALRLFGAWPTYRSYLFRVVPEDLRAGYPLAKAIRLVTSFPS